MTRHRSYSILSAALVALSVATAASAQKPRTSSARSAPAQNGVQPARDMSGMPSVKVLRAVDGASIVVATDNGPITIRLIGVESAQAASNSAKGTRDRQSDPSMQYLTDQLKGKSVYLEPENEQAQADASNRTLAYVYRLPDGLLVNQDLIAQGQARASSRRDFRLFADFQAAEKKAKAEKLGLWAQAGAAVGPVDKAKADSAQDAEPETFVFMKGTKKYHRQGCRLAAKGVVPITLAAAQEKKLEPCTVCKSDQEAPAGATASNTAQKTTKKKRYASQAEQRKRISDAMGTFDPSGGGGGGLGPPY